MFVTYGQTKNKRIEWMKIHEPLILDNNKSYAHGVWRSAHHVRMITDKKIY